MKECSASTICHLLLVGAGLPWACLGDGDKDNAATVDRNVRRRTRYISKIGDRKGSFLGDRFFARNEIDITSRLSFSMPDAPTAAPAKQTRGVLIQNKCGVTALERSRDILTELLSISDSSSLTNPETSEFKAREWLDNTDPAIICAENKERIVQRYRIAVLYFELGGSSWTRCKAEQDITDSDKEDECPGKRFLDGANECEWGGMSCGDAYSNATAEWLGAYYPLEIFNPESNNSNGERFGEFYGS